LLVFEIESQVLYKLYWFFPFEEYEVLSSLQRISQKT